MQNRKLKLTFFILILFLGISFCATKTQAYAPPIGIPDPGMWGSIHPIDSAAPATAQKCPSWPASETAGCYYIDNTNPNATNTGNTYGYPNKPRLTIPGTGSTMGFTYTYAAGSYVEIKGGPYTEDIWAKMNGTAENLIWFRGTAAAMPILRKKINVGAGSQYFIVEYLDFNGGNSGSGIGFSLSSNHAAVRNNTFRNMTWTGNSSAIGVEASKGQDINNIVFYNNTISDIDYGDLEYWKTVDHDYHGLGIGCWSGDATSEVHQIWFLNNYCERVGGNCVQVNSGNWPFAYRYTHHIYIGKNTATNLRQAGFWSKMASDVIFSENTVYNNDAWGSQNGDGLGYQYNPHNTWFIFNKVYDTNFGIRQSDSMNPVYNGWNLTGSAYGKWYVYNEVRHNGVLYYCKSTHIPDVSSEPGVGANWEAYWVASDGTATDAYDQRKVYIIGNTFRDIYPRKEGSTGTYNANDMFRSGVGIALWRGTEQRWVINNTISNVYDGITVNSAGNLTLEGNVISGRYSTGYQMDIGQAYAVTNADYNDWYDQTAGTRLRWNGTVYNSSSLFNAGKGQCAHCIDTDPKFVDAANNNYRLQSASGAKDDNIANSVYATFQSLYGISIAKDTVGTPRPQGSAWDIGAYEYDEGYVPPTATCSDHLQNQNETGVDCGGVCSACVIPTSYNLTNFISLINNWLGAGDASSNVNGDNIVNTKDLGIMMSGWSQ